MRRNRLRVLRVAAILAVVVSFVALLWHESVNRTEPDGQERDRTEDERKAIETDAELDRAIEENLRESRQKIDHSWDDVFPEWVRDDDADQSTSKSPRDAKSEHPPPR